MFPKMLGETPTTMGFSTKSDHDLGCEMGIPPFKETPTIRSVKKNPLTQPTHISPESDSKLPRFWAGLESPNVIHQWTIRDRIHGTGIFAYMKTKWINEMYR